MSNKPTNAELQRDLKELKGELAAVRALYESRRPTNAELQSDIQELKEGVAGLMALWQTGTGLVKFIRLAGSVVAALGAVWLAVRQFKGMP